MVYHERALCILNYVIEIQWLTQSLLHAAMGNLGMIPSKIQWLSCIVNGGLFYDMV